jgi:hypothetical protein
MLTRLYLGSLVALVASGSTLMASTSSFWPIEKPHKVHVTVLARTSSVRSSGGNRDVYLVQVRPKSASPFYGRVIDEFPFYDEGIPLKLTSEGAPFTLQLWRNHSCDAAINAALAATAVPKAGGSVSRSDSKQEATSTSLQAGSEGEELPCFSAVHRTWKYEGKNREPNWWR